MDKVCKFLWQLIGIWFAFEILFYLFTGAC